MWLKQQKLKVNHPAGLGTGVGLRGAAVFFPAKNVVPSFFTVNISKIIDKN